MTDTGKHKWEEEQKKNKLKGAITSGVVHSIILILFLFFGLSSAFPPPEEGILINFGTTETGLGDEPSFVTEQAKEIAPTQSQPATVQEIQESEGDIVTQDVEDAPAIKKDEKKKDEQKKDEKKTSKVDPKKEEKVAKEEKNPVKEEPKVDTKSMYTGQQSDENNPSNEGITYGPGDQGDPEGDISSKNYYGENTGLGNVGVGHDLSGRKMMYISLADETYKETGKIAVSIKVDRLGKVLFAKYTVKGSTSTDPTLIRLAEEAARNAKFSPNSNVAEEQFGTITFTFKLK